MTQVVHHSKPDSSSSQDQCHTGTLDDRISIIFTERRRLSCLRLSFGTLLYNSRYKNHEIVFVGDRIREPCEEGFEIPGFNTVEQYLTEFWIPILEKAGFTFTLITGNWSREEVDTWNVVRTPCYECWSYGIERAKNPWILVVGSDDALMPDWDHNIIKRFPKYSYDEYCFQLVHGFFVHPKDDPVCVAQEREHWINTKKDMSKFTGYQPDDHGGGSRLGWMPYYKFKAEWPMWSLKESELLPHFDLHKKDGVFIEAGGHRHDLSYWCQVVHQSTVKKISEFNENKEAYDWRRVPNEGEFPEALDLEFDNALNKIGVKKVGVGDSGFFNTKSFRCNPLKPHHFVFDVNGEPHL